MILGAGAAAMSALKGDDAGDTTNSGEATTSVDTGSKEESVLEQASDVMEDITDSLSSTFKAGAAALFGAGTAAASKLNEEESEATVSTEENTTKDNIEIGEDAAESAVDKVTDVVEDITEAATTTLKSAAGALFGLGAATASKLNGEEETASTEEGIDNVVDDATSVSEIVDKVTDSDDV